MTVAWWKKNEETFWHSHCFGTCCRYLQMTLRYFKILSNMFQQMFVQGFWKSHRKNTVSCSLFCSCDRNFRVMEKQTSEDTEEAHKFKSCHFEQVWAVCVLCENSCNSCELQYLANILQWGSWGTWSCRQRIEAAGIKTRKGGTQRQGGQQLKSADPQNVCLWHPMTLWPEWYILVHVSYCKETTQIIAD